MLFLSHINLKSFPENKETLNVSTCAIVFMTTCNVKTKQCVQQMTCSFKKQLIFKGDLFNESTKYQNMSIYILHTVYTKHQLSNS